MILKWLRKNTDDRVDPEELKRLAEESLEETKAQQAHVNVITSYLNQRKNQNGFGEDFEITLLPRRAS